MVEVCARTESCRELSVYYNNNSDEPRPRRHQPSRTISQMLPAMVRPCPETRRHSYRAAPRPQG